MLHFHLLGQNRPAKFHKDNEPIQICTVLNGHYIYQRGNEKVMLLKNNKINKTATACRESFPVGR